MFPGNNDMIEQIYIHQGRGFLKLSRDLHVGFTGLKITGGVIMAQDD